MTSQTSVAPQIASSSTQKLCKILEAEYHNLTTLVHLLKEEQRIILQRKSEELRLLTMKVEDQLSLVHREQDERNIVLKELLGEPPQPTHAGLAARLQTLPDSIREESLAIAQRIDVQLLMVQEFAWQNHILLSHSIRFLDEVLAPWLDPQSFSLYGQTGTLHKTVKNSNICQAVA